MDGVEFGFLGEVIDAENGHARVLRQSLQADERASYLGIAVGVDRPEVGGDGVED